MVPQKIGRDARLERMRTDGFGDGVGVAEHTPVLPEGEPAFDKQVGRARHAAERGTRDQVPRIVLGIELAGREAYFFPLNARQLLVDHRVVLRPERESGG